MNIVFTIIITIAMGYIAFMSGHIAEEQRKCKHIPLPWEKK